MIPSWIPSIGAPALGLFDKFSEGERFSGALASNVSHAQGAASRVGAFEVHVLQDVWNAKRPGAKTWGRNMGGGSWWYIYISGNYI